MRKMEKDFFSGPPKVFVTGGKVNIGNWEGTLFKDPNTW
jgi:hypothetical protein